MFSFRKKKPPVGPTLVAEATGVLLGTPFLLDGKSPLNNFMAVFEDDGDTGYLYGLDLARTDQPILDALHIYNVESVVDRDIPSNFQIIWSSDGMKVLLLINRYPHAAFDFVIQRGYCRSNFPPPSSDFSSITHEWSDTILDSF